MNNTTWDGIERWTLMLFAFSLSISIAAENIILGAGLLLALRRLAVSPDARRRLMFGVTIPLLVYLAFDFSATLFSGFPAHVEKWLEDKWVLMAYALVLTLADSRKKLHSTGLALVSGGVVMGLYAVVQFFTGWDFLRHQPLEALPGFGSMAVGSFSHHLTYGGIALIVFGFVFTGAVQWWRERGVGARWMGATVITGLGLLFSYARSALVGLVAGVGVLLLLLDRKIRRPLLIAVVTAGLLAVIFVPGLSERFLNSFSGGQHSEGPRIRLWLTSIEIIKHHPLGIGQSNFDRGFEQYHLPGVYDNHAHPHNDFLSVAVDGGLFALMAFLSIWLKFFLDFARTWKSGLTDHRIQWLLQAGVTSIAAILVGGLFQNYQSDAEVGALVWAVVGLTQSAMIMARSEADG